MAGYKAPDLNQRLEAARVAKQRALELLRNKPALDPAVVAERQAAREAREAAEAERREARRLAAEEAKAAKAAAALEKAAAAKKPEPVVMTEAERKAARDAKYAARKARKR